MPTIGPFHRMYWRARANAAAPVVAGRGGYPLWQSSVTTPSLFGALEGVRPLWEHVCWLWWLMRRVWAYRDPATRHQIETWIGRLEACDVEQLAVLDRVVQVMSGPYWAGTRQRVRACATTPTFHRPEMWVEYSRAVKANAGQAQNVFRHLKVVHELKAAHPGLSNPDAHLLVELGYQGFAVMRQ